MSELAYTINGERFDVPSDVAAWRVRRMKVGRGAPTVVYGEDGLPLFISIDTGIDELQQEFAAEPGRYRLDPVDADYNMVEGVPYAVIAIGGRRIGNRPINTDKNDSAAGDDPNALVRFMVEANRDLVNANIKMTETVASRFDSLMSEFGGMLEASSSLLRAADGAGLPAREPLSDSELGQAVRNALPFLEQLSNEEGEFGANATNASENAGESNTAVLMAMALEKVMPAVTQFIHKKMGLTPEQSDELRGVHRDDDDVDDDVIDVEDHTADAPGMNAKREPAQAPMTDAQFLKHLNAIQVHLSPRERDRAMFRIGSMGEHERAAWRSRIGRLSPRDAARVIREELRSNGVQS